MAKMTIHLAQGRDFFPMMSESTMGPRVQQFRDGKFLQLPPIDVAETGEDAAEEAFDLTNNPSRQEERMARYGNGRSVSTGDVVEIEGRRFMCMSFGWKEF